MTPLVITRLIDSYTVLVLANQADSTRGMAIEDVPVSRVVGGIEYPLRSEVEIKVAEKTVEALG